MHVADDLVILERRTLMATSYHMGNLRIGCC